ncbi:PIN-like domain-containing protein [Priestia aryabhattai]|uniref:PIN-like domain-containing protein n=1 Tax=Priestia aryabhattai TaxID=412384 RepID=UPI0015F66361|nr:PIN-like domain-containing protein [Priestia aryabhattai]
MLEQFRGFVGYSEEEFGELWGKAIFVVDTNVLINFYKYTSKESTKSLFDILKKLKENNRLWIPHQVALEYFFNYESNMYKQTEGYNLLGEELKTLQNNAVKIFSKVKSNHPYILTDKFQFFIDNLKTTNKTVEDELKKEIENLPDANQTQQDILDLLNGIVGEVYPQQRIEEIQNEGKERYEHKVPPGFKDKDDTNKKNYRTYGGIRYQQLYGDLLVWNQIIDKGKAEENPTPIIFITEEKKEDWWEKEGQNIKRPHPQLVQEFFNQTGENFYMYRTDNFVKFAKKYLNAEVTDEQVENVKKDVENIRQSEEKVILENAELLYFPNFAEDMTISKPKIKKAVVQKDIDLDSLVEYLNPEQRKMFTEKIKKAFDFRFDPTNSALNYNRAIDWALKVSVAELEKKVKELTAYIAVKDYSRAQASNDRLNYLPDEPTERGEILLKHIDGLEQEIKLLDFLGI